MSVDISFSMYSLFSCYRSKLAIPERRYANCAPAVIIIVKTLFLGTISIILRKTSSFPFSLQSHLERIVERPGKIVQRHAPLSRVESGTVTAEDMMESGIRTPCTFTTVFELRDGGNQTLVSRPSSFDLQSSTLAQIASYAASTGQILNIGDVRAWLNEKHNEGDAESARTILCMPIINGQRYKTLNKQITVFTFSGVSDIHLRQ